MKKTPAIILCMLLTISLNLCTIGTVFGAAYRSNFEKDTLGALNGQDSWITSTNGAANYANVVSDIVDPTNRCMLVQDTDGAKSINATLNFAALNGDSTDGIVTVQYRFNAYNVQGYGCPIQIRSGTTAVVDFYSAYTGTVQRPSGALVWLLNHPLPGGTPGIAKALQGVIYYPGSVWYNMKFVLNFKTKTVDVYYATYPAIPTTPVLSNIPFANDANNINSFCIGTQNWTSCETYLDDIYITDGYIADFDIQPGSATYMYSGSTITTNANLTMPVVGDGDAMVLAVAYNSSGQLIGVKSSPTYTKANLTSGVIPYTSTFPVNGTVSTVKLYVLESYASRIPYCEPAVCTKIN